MADKNDWVYQTEPWLLENLKKKKEPILPTMCPNSINLLQASKRLVLTLVPNPQPNKIHACTGTRSQLLNALCQHVLKLLTWSKMLIPSELNYIPLIFLSLSRSQVILHLVWLCRFFHMNFKVFYRLKTSWSWLNFGGFYLQTAILSAFSHFSETMSPKRFQCWKSNNDSSQQEKVMWYYDQCLYTK